MKLIKYLILTSIMIFFISNIVSALTLTDGLKGYWKFDENTSTHTKNEILNTNDSFSGLTWKKGKLNSALYWDGVPGRRLNISQNYETNNSGAINCWVNISGYTGERMILGQGDATSSTPIFEFRIADATNYPTYVFRNTGGSLLILNSNKQVLQNKYQMVTLDSDGSKIYIYLNKTRQNITVTSGTNTGQWFNDLGTFTRNTKFGVLYSNSAHYYTMLGRIDECAIYDRNISQSEIDELYNLGNALSYPFEVITMRETKILPLAPYSNETKLKGYCNATYSLKSNLKFYYRWYKNGALNTSGSKNGTQNLLNSINNITSFNENQNWTFSCLASDNIRNSTWLNSSTVLIKGLPSIVSVSITPSTAYKNDTLKGYCNSTDADTLNLKVYWRWYKNGALNESGSKNVTRNLLVNIANKTGLIKNQNWTFSCRAKDDTYNSSWMNSSVKTISNHAPNTPTLIYPNNLQTVFVVNATLNYTSADIDNDTITYKVFFGTSTPPNTLNYSGTSTNKTIKNLADATHYYWKVIASDGSANSSNSSIYNFYTSLSKPAINIVYPTNGTWIKGNLNNINFSFIPNDANGIDTCKIYSNITNIWKVENTNTSVITNTLTKFYLNLTTDRRYKYNIWCNDTTGISSFYAFGNISFQTDNTTPLMTVTSPLQGQSYMGGTTPLTISAIDTYLSTCNFILYDTPTMTILSSGNANCTGTTTLTTPVYSGGYTVKINALDLAGNTKTIYRNFTSVASVVTPSGGGGGGIVLSNKRNCKITASPSEISFKNLGTEKITLLNKDTITYNPSIDVKVFGISKDNLIITNFITTILPEKSNEFGVKYLGQNEDGTFKIILSDLNCNDITINGAIGKSIQQKNPIEELLSAGLLNFFNSEIIPNFFIKVWMIYLIIIFLFFIMTSKLISENMKKKKYLVILLWVSFNLLIPLVLTGVLVILLRGI